MKSWQEKCLTLRTTLNKSDFAMAVNIAHFTELLQQEQQLVVKIHQLLEQEEQALTSNNLAQLEALQGQQQTSVTQLQQHAEQRLQWMQSKELPLSSECLTHPAIAQEESISRLWHSLSEQYIQNQKLSAKLAEVTLGLRHRTQQKLNILHGRKNETDLYNKSGKTNSNAQGLNSIQA